jgi:uncharacterized membrane protein YeaQ/YmgE (transglycosylase-associated protein family)
LHAYADWPTQALLRGFATAPEIQAFGITLRLVPRSPMADDAHCGLPHRRRGIFVAAFYSKGLYEALVAIPMHIITLSVVSVLVGWLSTLILLSDLDNLSLLEFGVGVTGAAFAGGLLAPLFGISITCEYGLSLSGTFIAWLGATSLLALVNLARHGHILCGRRRPHGNRAMQV